MRPAPWTDPRQFFIDSSDTRHVASSAIGADPDAWWGTAGRLVPLPGVNPEAEIGVLSTIAYDETRGLLTALAFQQRGQTAGYLPDTGPTTFDKVNLRDGHYPIWSPSHLVTALDSGGSMTPAAAAVILPLVVPRPSQGLLDDIIASGDVPQCAMQVSRDTAGALAPTAPPILCGCYFDQKTTGHTSCQSCVATQSCPASAQACNYGYCEAR